MDLCQMRSDWFSLFREKIFLIDGSTIFPGIAKSSDVTLVVSLHRNMME